MTGVEVPTCTSILELPGQRTCHVDCQWWMVLHRMVALAVVLAVDGDAVVIGAHECCNETNISGYSANVHNTHIFRNWWEREQINYGFICLAMGDTRGIVASNQCVGSLEKDAMPPDNHRLPNRNKSVAVAALLLLSSLSTLCVVAVATTTTAW